MGFNKRFLSEESIRAFAKNGFNSFEVYMTCADAYIVSMGWASKIYDKRKDNQQKLNDLSQSSSILKETHDRPLIQQEVV